MKTQSLDTIDDWYTILTSIIFKIHPISSNDFASQRARLGFSLTAWIVNQDMKRHSVWQFPSEHDVHLPFLYCQMCKIMIFFCQTNKRSNIQDQLSRMSCLLFSPAFCDKASGQLNRHVLCWGEADTTETESAKRSRRCFQQTLWLGWLVAGCW